MLTWLRVLFDSAAREAARRARAFVTSNYGASGTLDALLRADETDRWVFAVFYRPRHPVFPAPYKVVEVMKRSAVVRELAARENDPYLLKGRK